MHGSFCYLFQTNSLSLCLFCFITSTRSEKKIVGNWCTMYCTNVEILYAQSFLCFSHITGNWIGVHLAWFIHPSKVWSMLHHTSMGMSSEYLTQTPTLNLSLPLLFFIIKFVSLFWFLRLYHFYSLFTAYFLCEKLMSVRHGSNCCAQSFLLLLPLTGNIDISSDCPHIKINQY